jgi:hypothetical protein
MKLFFLSVKERKTTVFFLLMNRKNSFMALFLKIIVASKPPCPSTNSA